MMPNRSRGGVLAVGLLLAAGLALAAGATAQESIEVEVLGEDSPISFPSAEDTVIEQENEEDASKRVEWDGVTLNGPDTTSTPLSSAPLTDYLLGLSAQAGAGLPDVVKDRYRHGNVESATLSLNYQRGCQSPSGQLTVRKIASPSWSPFTIDWNDTQQSQAEGPVDVNGEVLTRANPSADNPNAGCGSAELSLPNETIEAVFTGDEGGLKVAWNGEQSINLSTLNDEDPAFRPQLVVDFTTNAATVEGFDVDGGFPAVLPPGNRLTVAINVTDEDPLPPDAVTLNVTPTGDSPFAPNPKAEFNGQTYVARQSFPSDAEGSYKLEAIVEDSDGWITEGSPNASAPHVIVDGTAPDIFDEKLGDANSTEPVIVDQDQTIRLQANLSDAACAGNRNPCADWALEWQDTVLAQGNVTPTQRIDANVTPPIPGNGTARLVVEDVAGNRNESTTWPLNVTDTHPPELDVLDESDLAPNLTTTVENGTEVTLAFTVDDHPPVNATLLIDRATPSVRDLPAPDQNGRVKTTLDLPRGRYSPVVVLADSVHEVQVPFGGLNVVGRDVPTVTIDKPGSRIPANGTIHAEIRDENLAPRNTTVNALVNGVELRPTVQATAVENGQDLDIVFDGLDHGDEVRVRVRAVDHQGLNASASVEVTVDGKAPTLDSPEDGAWYAPGSTVTFEASDPGGSSVTLDVNGASGSASGTAPVSVDIGTLVAGPNQLTKVTTRLTDDTSNTFTETVRVGVDRAKPDVSTEFTEEGFVVEAHDNESGVATVDVRIKTGQTFEKRKADRLGPTTFAVRGTQDLARGDRVLAVVTVADATGKTTKLGTRQAPLNLTVPDRPPRLTLDRASAAVGDSGVFQWNATDPDRDPITVSLTVEGPEGTVIDETVAAEGLRTIHPNETGRYAITMEARSAGVTDEASTFFYLSPDGIVSSATGIASKIEPGQALTFSMSFPSEPTSVHVVAVDQNNVTHTGDVDLSGTSATVTFEDLAKGTYDIETTVVHESGATERARIASVNVEEPLSSQLGSFVLPLLIILALLGIAAIVWVWYESREEAEEEETEQAPR